MAEDEKKFFEKVGTKPKKNAERLKNFIEKGLVSSGGVPTPTSPQTEKPMDVSGGASWASSGENFWRVGQTHANIPSGVYQCNVSQTIGPFLQRIINDTDELITFPDSDSEALLQEIKTFSRMKAKFVEYGFLFKRGIILYGAPGSGKTTTLQLMIKMMVNEGEGIAIFIQSPGVATDCLHMIRQVEPERQIVCIMEDLDALVDTYGEPAFLALLDGEAQINNCVFLATTNYPERLDKRFVDRPSRFDTVKHIGMPNRKAREMFFRLKLKNAGQDELKQFVDASDGYSVAHMKEMIILTQCFQRSLEEAKKKLDTSIKRPPTSRRDPNSAAFGFTSGQLGKSS